MTTAEMHNNLLSALEKKVPDKSKLVEILMDTLHIEKGAVYRRLRGDVPFTFYEVVIIAKRLEISLNNFMYTDSVRKGRFELTFLEYMNMNEMEYKRWEDLIAFFGTAKNDPHSEIADSSNMLPICIYTRYDSLIKYYLFKYEYLLHGLENRITYSELQVPDRLNSIFRSYAEAFKNFASTTFILDYMVFQYLITDLRYFSDIHLITTDDLQQIKNDLFSLLNDFESIALTGCFETTENRVSIYISDVNLDSTYICTQIKNIYVGLVRTFILNTVESFDQSSFRKIKEWIQSQTKSSTLITQSGAAYRADFFEKQRQLITEL